MRASSILLAIFVLGTGAGSAQERPSGSTALEGTVRGQLERPGVPLAFAVVQVRAPGLFRSVLADSLGRYRIEGLPPGIVRLSATHPGHRTANLDVLLPAAGSVQVDLDLETHPVELPEVRVQGDPILPPAGGRELDPVDLARVDVAALDAAPGIADAGIVGAVRALPGNDPADPSDVLFMRGSTADLKLVLLDGAPVYTPFHMAGLLPSFDPGALGEASLHVGGAPARYDGGLSYILDLRTRRPRADRARAGAALDLLSGVVSAEGPVGARAAYALSARTLHHMAAGVLGGGGSPYGYRDALGSVDVQPRSGHLVRATGFWNRESVALDLTADAVGATGAGGVLPDDAWWSNRAGSMFYRITGDELRMDLTAAASTYRAALPLQPSPTEEDPDPEALLATGRTDRIRVVAEVARTTGEGSTRAGWTLDRLEVAYDAGVLGGPVTSRSSARGTVTGMYVDLTRRVSPTLVLRGGVRADAFSGPQAGLRISPRASAMWRIGPQALLTVAAGRYRQHTATVDGEVERSVSDAVAAEPGEGALLPVATADHVVVSLAQELGAHTRLGLEGYWKRFEGLRPELQETVRSSGVDLRVQRRGARTTTWVGYGLSWFWSATDFTGRATEFAGRHLLSAGFTGDVGERLGGEVRISYSAGLPYTSLPFGHRADREDVAAGPIDMGGEVVATGEATPPLGPGPDQEFLRVDLEVHADFVGAWAGHRWRVRPYLRILNALDRRDALFYAFRPWRDESLRPLAARAVIPVVGVSWRF